MVDVYRTKSGRIITDEMIEQWAAEADRGYLLDENGHVITIARAVQTCFGAPSQWDAWDASGRYWYLRYRHGYGMICPDSAGSDPLGTFVYGDEYDGVISLTEFARLAGIKLADGVA